MLQAACLSERLSQGPLPPAMTGVAGLRDLVLEFIISAVRWVGGAISLARVYGAFP